MGPEAEALGPLQADGALQIPAGSGASDDVLPDEALGARQAQPVADVGKSADLEPGVPVQDGLRSGAMRLRAVCWPPEEAAPCKPDVDRFAAQSCVDQAFAAEQAEPALKVFASADLLSANWAPAH